MVHFFPQALVVTTWKNMDKYCHNMDKHIRSGLRKNNEYNIDAIAFVADMFSTFKSFFSLYSPDFLDCNCQNFHAISSHQTEEVKPRLSKYD